MVIFISGMIFVKLSPVWLFIALLGMLGYYLKQSQWISHVVPVATLGLLLIVLLSRLSASSKSVELPLSGSLNIDMIYWVIAVFMALILSKLSMSSPRNHYVVYLERLGSKMSVFSYSLFLTHFQVLFVFRYLWGEQFHDINFYTIAIFFLVCLACVGVAYGIYWLVEKLLAALLNY